MREINLSWAGRMFLSGCCVIEREFTETVDTAEEGGTVMSKIGGRFCDVTGGVNLGGRGGKNQRRGSMEWVGAMILHIGQSGQWWLEEITPGK